MNSLKVRFALLFTVIVASILILFILVIYTVRRQFYYNDFALHIKDRANLAANLLIMPEDLDVPTLTRLSSNLIQRLPQQGIRIYNENNFPIYIDDSSSIRVYTDLITTVRKKNALSYMENGRHVEAYTFTHNSRQYVIVASAVDKEGNKQLQQFRSLLFMTFLFSLGVTFITSFIFSQKALSPLSDLSRQAEGITLSNLGARLKAGRKKDEIYQLTESFNKMLERLQLSSDVQKTFLSNVSHELRTPLTVMLSNIDVALMKERNEHYYKESLSSLKGDVKKLSTLTDKLIELAQTSYDASKANFEPVRMDELLWEAKTEVVTRYPESNIIIQSSISPENDEKLIVKGDKRLLTIAIINLLDNACKFSQSYSPVTCKTLLENDKLVIHIKDQGIGINQEEQTNLMQPFYRAPSAKNHPGFGLGLSITNTILKNHHISLSISSAVSCGTTVTLQF